MNGSAASVAYWILPLILGVLAIGVLAMVALAVRKEDRKLLAVRRGAGCGDAGDPAADPVRRRRPARSAAWPGVVMHGPGPG